MEQLTKLPLQDVFIWAFRVQKFSLSRSMSYDRDVTSRCCFKLRICEPLCSFHVDWIDRGKEESSFTYRLSCISFFPYYHCYQFIFYEFKSRFNGYTFLCYLKWNYFCGVFACYGVIRETAREIFSWERARVPTRSINRKVCLGANNTGKNKMYKVGTRFTTRIINALFIFSSCERFYLSPWTISFRFSKNLARNNLSSCTFAYNETFPCDRFSRLKESGWFLRGKVLEKKSFPINLPRTLFVRSELHTPAPLKTVRSPIHPSIW